MDDWIRKVGAPWHGRAEAFDVDLYLAARKAGFSMTQIAAYLGIGRSTLYLRVRGL